MRLLPVVLVLAAVFILGCGSEFAASVSGTVTLDGKTIGPGVVNFSPTDLKSNPAVGTISPDGSYVLKSNRTEGLPPGKYRVAVTVFEQSPEAARGERSNAPPKLLTPAKYDNAETSGFEFDVVTGSNTIDLPLTSQ